MGYTTELIWLVHHRGVVYMGHQCISHWIATNFVPHKDGCGGTTGLRVTVKNPFGKFG